MALFGNKKNEGGLMDVIRCDEPSYLIWKWRPSGQDANSTKKENAIRWGSSLRVKDGEVAVFVYKQKDGVMQDFIEGPFDDTIKTGNFPILASIVGVAFGGGTPFQAEVYFINLAGVIQVKFAVPYFDVFDPRFLDYAVPTAVRGSITFKITDYKEFIKLHRLIDFDFDAFNDQIKDAVRKYIKGIVSNVPSENGIPVLQMERKLLDINDIVEQKLKTRLVSDFGVTVSGVDIATIECDKTSSGYQELKAVTQDITTATTQAQAAVNIKNIEDMQKIQVENLAETQRIQREEMQRAQKLQTESSNLAAHAINQQTGVMNTAASQLGELGKGAAMNIGGGDGGGMGFNPASMMAGMAIGGAVGQNMANMMNNMMSGFGQAQNMAQNQAMQNAQMNASAPVGVPPIPPAVAFNVAVNGQSTGPFDIATLTQMATNGQLTKESLVWKNGMANWTQAGTVAELAGLFAPAVPPVPPVPPTV